MSLEDETIELSLIYHASREYVEELERGMKDCNIKIEKLQVLVRDYYNLVGFMLTWPDDKHTWEQRIIAIQQRTQELITKLPSPPAC